MNLQEQIKKILREETTQSERFEKRIDRIEKFINKNEFLAVKKIMLDYNEQMDAIDVSIFFDRKFAIENATRFNKVKKESGLEIQKLLEHFPYKFYYYLHYM